MERREIIDLASGVAGGLLLVTAIVLFAVVPEEEPVPPTFDVKYVASETTVPLATTIDFTEGQTERIPITIDSPYVYRISFTVTWTDDVEASEPDTFQFKIFEPDGEQVTDGARIISNEPPVANTDGSTGLSDGTYTAQPMEFLVEKSLGAPPRDEPVSGESLDETVEQARERLLADLALYAPGEWSLEVYLDQAGDCPSGSAASDADNQQAVACTQETGGNTEDEGNPLQVVSVTYTTYDIEIQELN